MSEAEWFSGARCPRCGAQLLRLDREVWCSLITCEWGLSPAVELPAAGDVWSKPSFPLRTFCKVVGAADDLVSVKRHPLGRRVHDWPLGSFLEVWERE